MSTAAIPPVEASRADETGQPSAQALVPAPQAIETETGMLGNAVAMCLPVELEVAIPLRNFRVRNLLALSVRAVVESQWVQGEDMPLAAGDVQLAWSEFEVVDTQLAVRLTRLV